MTDKAPDELYFYDDWLEKHTKGRLLCGNNRYLRAEIVHALVAEAYEVAAREAREQALREAADKLRDRHYEYVASKGRSPFDYTSKYSIAATELRALIEKGQDQ